MFGRMLILSILILFLTCSSISAQECGDADGDGSLNIMDVITMMCSIQAVPGSCYPIFSDVADVDGRNGLTVSDVAYHWDFRFNGGPPLDCSEADTYSFTISTEDTVFLPEIGPIPEEINTLILPINVSFTENVHAFYLPMLPNPGPNWQLTEVVSVLGESQPGGNIVHLLDTTVLSGVELFSIVHSGTSFTLKYTRIGSGPSAITPSLVDRGGVLKYGVAKDGDMFRPTVVYSTVLIPVDTILVSESNLHFDAISGSPSQDSMMIHFTSNFNNNLQFSLASSEPWIRIKLFTVGELSTPDSAEISINSSLAPIGTNFGVITVVPGDESVFTSVEQIEITSEISPPLLYPIGDFTCDGVVDIADLTYFILYLFIGGPMPVQCQ